MEINNEIRANQLVVCNPDLFQFICDICNYQNLIEKTPTNDFEALRSFHRRSSLEDLIKNIVQLNEDYIKSQTEPEKKSKITAK